MNKKNVIISILLIAIIIILLVFCKFGKIHHNDSLIPTGNVDVFDIDIFCNHKISDNNNTNENDNETNNIIQMQYPKKEIKVKQKMMMMNIFILIKRARLYLGIMNKLIKAF